MQGPLQESQVQASECSHQIRCQTSRPLLALTVQVLLAPIYLPTLPDVAYRLPSSSPLPHRTPHTAQHSQRRRNHTSPHRYRYRYRCRSQSLTLSRCVVLCCCVPHCLCSLPSALSALYRLSVWPTGFLFSYFSLHFWTQHFSPPPAATLALSLSLSVPPPPSPHTSFHWSTSTSPAPLPRSTFPSNHFTLTHPALQRATRTTPTATSAHLLPLTTANAIFPLAFYITFGHVFHQSYRPIQPYPCK